MPAVPEGYKHFLETVLKTSRRHGLLKKGDRVLIGVSGGPDSIALLHVLHQAAPRWDLHLAVAHLNHGLRGDASDRDEDFVAERARELNLQCFSKKITSDQMKAAAGQGPEAASRRLRYRFFARTAQQESFDLVALGHQADDNAEQVLMGLVRGSGPSGLSGIPAKRRENQKTYAFTIVRPLLEIRRSEILTYLDRIGASYMVDATNTDQRFLRNRIRHHLMPLLEREFNPDIVGGLNRLAGILQSEKDWLSGIIDQALHHRIANASDGHLEIMTSGFETIHTALQRRLLRAAIRTAKGDMERISHRHIESLRTLLLSGRRRARLDFPDRLQVHMDGQRLTFVLDAGTGGRTIDNQDTAINFEYRVNGPTTLRIAETGWRLRISLLECTDNHDATGQLTAVFDMRKTGFPLIVRNFRPGDRFRPSGMTGHQKLKKFFIDHKIPKTERLKYPLLISNGQIIWIAGLRTAATGLPDPTTRQCLKAELLLV